MVPPSKVVFAFSAGAVTFFSPCSYPLLPGYLAYFLGDADQRWTMTSRVGRGLSAALATSLGFVLVYGLLAGVAISIGSRHLSDIVILEPIVGLVLIGTGLMMALERGPRLRVALPERRRTVGGFVSFGVVYATAAAGCTAPLFVGITGIALSSGPTGALLLLGSYALGMSLLIIVVTVVISVGGHTVLEKVQTSTVRLHQLSGVALMLAGIGQIYWFVFELGGMAKIGFTV